MIEAELRTGETVPLGTVFRTMFVIAQMRDHTSLLQKIIGVEEAPMNVFSEEEITLLRQHGLVVAIGDDKVLFHRDIAETMSATIQCSDGQVSFTCPSEQEEVRTLFKKIFSE